MSSVLSSVELLNGGFQPVSGATGYGLDLKSVLSTAELNRRPSRPPDHASENRALIALAQEMAVSPDGILQKLADTALVLCRAHSAGLSLLEEGDQKTKFHWRAIAGAWSPHLGGGTPRDFGPCGTVLDRNVALLFSHPERDFPYFGEVKPLLEEGLLIPFHIKEEAVGTIWVVSHDESRRFDAEDLRVMTNLGTFAAAAYQNLLSLNAAQRIAAIVESSSDAIVSKTLDGVITTWNAGATRLFGYTAEEIIGQPVTILIPADRQDEERMIIDRIERGECVDHYETIRRRKDGSLVPISLTISPVRNGAGEIVGASKIAQDISERKQKEERIDLLAHEVDHRSKNLLALVQAVVQLTQGETPGALKTAIEGRIRALANAHRLLAQSRWAGADLHSLVAEELAPYCPEGQSRTEICGPTLTLKPKSAQSISIILHELTTNAVKYGALSTPAGRVGVEWSRATDGRLFISWTETGGPPVKPPSHRGVGTRVIEQIIYGELDGEARFDWRADGFACGLALDPQAPS
jgi:PAS domain S-box-containing protein